ncbi:MAG: SDR family oxidoreductase [Burkholderiales bacterium]|nr:SDR family oxidoreductase [Burkholderiales bacterium]
MAWGSVTGSAVVEGEIAWKREPTPPGRRLQDKVVVVTGASRGFGKLIALAAAGEGAHVTVTYVKNKAMAEDVADAVRQSGRKATALRCDIAKLEDVRALADAVWKEFGRCDVLVNNAGETAADKMSWRDLREPVIDHILGMDIKGTMFCTHEFGQRMLDLQQAGSIVNIGSNVISTGSPRAPEYAAAKYAILGITKSYALALAPYVRVNFAGPGWMDTQSLKEREDWTPERRRFLVDNTPLRAIGDPVNLVPVVLFLASQDALHMTGNSVICDGGFSMPGA